MAVEAVVSVVLRKVTDLLIQESVIFDKVIDQVEDIRIELRQMRGFLTDAEERQKSDPDAKKWVREYLETLYQVEDMVESYVLKLARKKREMGFLKNYGFFFHDKGAWQSLLKKMKHVEEKIKKLNQRKPGHVEDASLRCISLRREENQYAHPETSHWFGQTKQMPSSFYEEDDSGLIGFKDELEELEERLTGKGGKIIGVTGPPGCGKTTLVRRTYSHKTTKQRFDCHAWLDISEEHALKDLLLKVWHLIDKKRDRELTVLNEGQLIDKLFDFLQRRKYLIVLDDAREKPDAWKKLIEAFPDEVGSKVIVITRYEAIAEAWDCKCRPQQLMPLSEEKSRKLILRKSCLKEDSPFHHHPTFGREILEKCQGLPLNLVLLGGLLSTNNMSYEGWTQLLTQANWYTTEIWLLSYNDLPPHYKLCLLYLALFPKEFNVSVRRILRLWLAEGFLRQTPGSPGSREDLAEECFNYLVSRNLIKISKFRSDGGPRKCCLPGFLREHLSPRAQEISLFHIHQSSTEPSNLLVPASGVRRIVEYADITNYASGCNSNSNHVENLRSYLSFNFPRYDTPAKEVSNFLCKIIGKKGFGLLRVLDLEGKYKPILPPSLKHLIQLRYLGLRWTFLDALPESVGELPYLETLDLKRTCIDNLPGSVWKLEHLRHLNLPNVRLDLCVQQPSSHLLTLWGLLVDDGCKMEDGLSQLTDLRELGITCHLTNFDILMSWITSLGHLQSLSLTSKDKMGRPSNLNLEPLSELHKLSHLELLGKLSYQLTKDQFPPNLKVLTLSLSEIHEDPMWILSQLPCLAVLRLLAKSYVGQKMHCQQNGFRSLRVLKLWMLDELQEWTVQQGGMLNIRELNIRCCQKLKEIPLELLQRTTLEELTLTNMPEEFVQHVTKNKSRHTNLTTNRFEFNPLPWEKDPDLWQ